MATIINLREWIMERIEKGTETEKELNFLYYHHMRIRMQEALVRESHNRKCPHRN
jgi:hypothetical protein